MSPASTTLLILLFWIIGTTTSLFLNGISGLLLWQVITAILALILLENYKCECGEYHSPGKKTNCIYNNQPKKEEN